MKKTYEASCHCGKVRISAELDLTAGGVKCNCSICTKTRLHGMVAKPAEFRVLSGQDDLTDYQFASKTMHHPFCKHCGVRVFSRGMGPDGEFYTVRLAALDGVDASELAEIPVAFANGRDNKWWEAPAVTKHL